MMQGTMIVKKRLKVYKWNQKEVPDFVVRCNPLRGSNVMRTDTDIQV